MSKKAKWVVEAKVTTREEFEKYFEKPENYNVKDFNEVEISVIREDYKLGFESYGWGGFGKIILFDNGDYTEEEMEWMKKIARAVANTLNKGEL